MTEISELRRAARAAGQLKFDPKTPCVNGHAALRWVSSSGCVVCVHLRQKGAKRHRDPEERKRANKRYYSKLGSMAKQIERGRTQRAKKPEQYREAHRRRRKENPEQYRAYIHRRRARKLKGGGNHTGQELLDLGTKQKWKCASPECRKSIKGKYHVDHILPLARGGSDFIKNVQLLCPPCNHKKSAKDPIVWAQEMGLLL